MIASVLYSFLWSFASSLIKICAVKNNMSQNNTTGTNIKTSDLSEGSINKKKNNSVAKDNKKPVLSNKILRLKLRIIIISSIS